MGCVEVGDASLSIEAEIRDALGVVKRSEARLACWKSELLAALNRLLSEDGLHPICLTASLGGLR